MALIPIPTLALLSSGKGGLEMRLLKVISFLIP